ncbi:hypothetical protein MKEN_00861500 [Mycena kentingensis (nom. inval.)]|nr:hypothetical protein MKEN_00861500 [Mycena kentingensis (nom. inval.)]
MDYDYKHVFDTHLWDIMENEVNQKFEIVKGRSGGKGYFIHHPASRRYLTPARSGRHGVVYMECSEFPGEFSFDVGEQEGFIVIRCADKPGLSLNVDDDSDAFEDGTKIVARWNVNGESNLWRVEGF